MKVSLDDFFSKGAGGPFILHGVGRDMDCDDEFYYINELYLIYENEFYTVFIDLLETESFQISFEHLKFYAEDIFKIYYHTDPDNPDMWIELQGNEIKEDTLLIYQRT